MLEQALALTEPQTVALCVCVGELLPEELTLALAEAEAEALMLALFDIVLESEAAAVGVSDADEEGEDVRVERLMPSKLAVGLGEATKVLEEVGLTLPVT